MPRYRFSWENLDAALLRNLCAHLDLDPDDPPRELKAEFGARPKEEFVDRAWPVLRDFWLASDRQARRAVVASLRERGLGASAVPDEMEFLRSCRNTIGLRRVVLPEFITVGEREHRVKPRLESDDASGSGDLGGLGGRARIGEPAKRSAGSHDGEGDESSNGTDDEDDDSWLFAPDDEDVPNATDHLRRWVHAVLGEATKGELRIDENGDVLLVRGSTLVMVGVDDDPLSVVIDAVLLMDVDASEPLLRRLNELNEDILLACLYHVEDDRTVYMRASLLAVGLTAHHFIRHLVGLAEYANAVDDEIQLEFGGHTAMEGMRERSDAQWV